MGNNSSNWLLTVALICSLAGIATLFFIAQNLEPKRMKIGEIAEKNLGDYVFVEGVVCRLRESRGNQFLTLCDDGEIDVPLFDARVETEIGDYISVSGTVSKYKERLQIQIDDADIKISRVIWGMCTKGKMDASMISYLVEESFEGPCGLIKDGSARRLIAPNAVLEGARVGELLEFSGRVNRVKDLGELTLYSLFGHDEDFISHEELLVSDEVSGFGISCEKDGYDEVFILFCRKNEAESETVASSKSRPEGFPVRTRGTIVFIKQYAETTYIKLRDGTGYIFATIPKTDGIEEGFAVEIRGTVHGGKISVYDEGVRVVSTEKKRTMISDITRDFLGEKVLVGGDVTEVFVHEDFVNLVVEDETGEILIYFPKEVVEDFLRKGTDVRAVRFGYGVEIFGRVDEYRGRLEVIPESMRMRKREIDVPISSLDGHMGDTVTVAGTVERIYVSKNGHVFLTLTDDTGSIEVVFFSSVAERMKEVYNLRVGEKIRVWGKVNMYEGRLEIVADAFEPIQSLSLNNLARQSPTLRASPPSRLP